MFKLFWPLLFCISIIISFCLTLFYIKWALKHSILDIPNKRSSHVKPVPRGGGITIIIAFYLCLFCSFLVGQPDKYLFFALLPGIGIAVIGFFDDYRTLPPAVRLMAQFLCSGIALYFLGGFDGFFGDNLKLFWSIIALFGFVWYINLFNFLDGSDGYASMEAISIGLILWYFTGMNLLLLLVFSVGGFLYWNWPKAKIFMGDVGSTTLGYILIVFGIYLHNNFKLNFVFWLIITSLFWFDATVTLLRRIKNKEKLSKAHKKHMYQRAIQSGFSHLQIMLAGFAINILLFIISLSIISNIFTLLTGVFIVLVILMITLIYVDRKFPFSVKP
jgi:UDP-N-acetylmuramyl pentapeptide phosphotransferase/UDP-N-acetylglucosamine-1-phosphate transferase